MKQSIVFFSKQAIVIGPTPPGTGVSALAFFETSSNATSPTIPFSVLLIPTSITIVSFLTHVFAEKKIDLGDEITSGSLYCHNGEITHQMTKDALEGDNK